MCGVIGYYPINPRYSSTRTAFGRLFEESTIRGLHAYGLAQEEVLRTFDAADISRNFDPSKPALAHARYSTSGDWKVLENNQPIVVGSLVLVFNGVLHMGTKEEMEADHQIRMITDNDGEIFLQCREDRITPAEFLAETMGSFAGLWFDIDGKMYAGRNARRPLWRVEAYGGIWYASTRDIFLRAGFPDPVPQPTGVWRVPRR